MPVEKSDIPNLEMLINPTLRVLHRLGGSGSVQEISDGIVSDLDLPEDVAELLHGKTSQTEVGYRSSWARTYLKTYGLIENSDHGIWALTAEGAKTAEVDARDVIREVQRRQLEARRETEAGDGVSVEVEDVVEEGTSWQERLLEVLQSMDPIAFERLCQRLLRESGFLEVEVTKRSGDGGIDGYGTIRIGGLISFNVLFQSKRYRSNIGPDVVRDFRGAMVGRADKGLIITTGGFTRDARREATRDGAPPIDLIDGQLLMHKLKELGLGVTVQMVEEVEVNVEWFSSI
jgi:restriction system protein